MEAYAVNKYFKELRERAKVADSIVCKCLLLSKQGYILEQTISVEVGPPKDGWHAIIWLDRGMDLAHSLQGPWNPRPDTLYTWETHFFPVIVHQDDSWPLHSPTDNTSQYSGNFSAIPDIRIRSETRPKNEWRAAQNICLLPFLYGSRLDKILASRDALYALSELFRFAASAAEVQSFNFIEKRINHELSLIETEESGQ